MGESNSKSALKEKPKIPLMKFVALGNACAGKSSLLYRLKHGKLPENQMATIGIDFQILYQDGFKLQAWDVAGRELVRTIVKAYYRGASGIIFMIDSANTDCFDDALDYLNTILKDEDIADITIMVVANKQDLNNAVGPEVIEEKVKEKCTIRQGITLFVMPMSVTDEDDRSMQLAYRLFFKTMKRKRAGKTIQSGLIPHAWETAEKEAEDSAIDDDNDDDGEETKVGNNDDVTQAKEKEGTMNLNDDEKKKSFFSDPVHYIKSVLIH